MALITTAAREELIALFTAMFRAAPGATNLSAMVAAYESGATTAQIAASLALRTEFQTIYPTLQTADEFAAALISTMLPASTPAGAVTWATGWITGQLAAGKSRAQIITEAVVAIRATTNTNYTDAKTLLANKVDVATYYSVTKLQSSTSLATLQDVIDDVTVAASSVTTAKATIDGIAADATGQGYALTVNQDVITGTNGNDTFESNVAVSGVTAIDTLQGFDQINGGNGTDELNVTLNGGASVAPTLSSVENVNVRFTTAGSALSLVGATGTTNATVSNSTAVGTLTSIGNAAVTVSNQKVGMNINGATSTAMSLSFDTVGAFLANIPVDLGSATANKATSYDIKLNNAYVTLSETTAGAATTALNINSVASGTTSNSLTVAAADLATVTNIAVTGAGNTTVGGSFAVLKSLTAATGGVTVTSTNATAGDLTVATGGGKDTLTAHAASIKSITTGGGNDTVTLNTGAVAAAATIDLGDGNDTVTLSGTAFATGATIGGGAGTDTIGMPKANYATISAYIAGDLAKISGFEVLSITDALATGDNINVSKLTGVVSFTAAAGITTANAADVSGLGANSTVTLAGAVANNGTLTATLATDTSADSLTLALSKDYADNNDTVIDNTAAAHTFVAAQVESLTVNSTGKQTATFTAVLNYKADTITNTLTLTGSNALTSITVTGGQPLVLSSTAAMDKLVTVNGSANTGGLTFSGAAAAVTSPAMTITGSATAANTLTGTTKGDTITGGSAVDTITGGGGADTINLSGGGNDILVIAAATDSTLINLDSVSGFSANTVGQGTGGVANELGATATVADRTGDVIDLTMATPTRIEFSVQGNASDAQTFIQNAATDGTFTAVNAALDSSSSRLYIDMDNNGTVDTVIHLAGVTTLTTAAFVI